VTDEVTFQYLMQGAGHRTQDRVIDRGAEAVGRRPQRRQLGTHHAETPVQTGPLYQRARRGRRRCPPATRGHGGAQLAPGPRHVEQCAEPAAHRVDGEPAERGRTPWEHRGCLRRPLVGEVGQDGESTDTVGQHVVDGDHQRGTAVGEAGDQHRRPQRPGPRQALGDDLGDEVQQCALVTGLGAAHVPHMPPDVEPAVVDPYRTVVVFVLRTHRSPPWRSRPAGVLVAAALAGVAVATVLPYTPIAARLGFTALPPAFLLVLVGLVVVYLALVEATKRTLLTPQDLRRPVSPPSPRTAGRRIHRRAARFGTRVSPRRPAGGPAAAAPTTAGVAPDAVPARRP
jgi:hypothetical protein